MRIAKRWPVHVLLVGLLVASVAIYVLFAALSKDTWQKTWMPNFIATWTGLIVVVLIVEHIVDSEAETLRAPMRAQAASELSDAMSGVLAFAMLASGDEPHEPIRAAEYLARWAGEVPRQLWLVDPHAIRQLADSLRTAESKLDVLRLKYSLGILREEEWSQINELQLHLTRAARDIDRCAHQAAGSSMGISRHAMTEISRISANTADDFSRAADVFRSLTGDELELLALETALNRNWQRERMPELDSAEAEEDEQAIAARFQDLLRRRGTDPAGANARDCIAALFLANRETRQRRAIKQSFSAHGPDVEVTIADLVDERLGTDVEIRRQLEVLAAEGFVGQHGGNAGDPLTWTLS